MAKIIAPFQTRRALTLRVVTNPKPQTAVGIALLKAAKS